MDVGAVAAIRLHYSHFSHEVLSSGVWAIGITLTIADIAITIGLFCFSHWARVGLIAWVVGDFTSRLCLMNKTFANTAGSWALSYIVNSIVGALIAMSFLPPLSAAFANKRSSQAET